MEAIGDDCRRLLYCTDLYGCNGRSVDLRTLEIGNGTGQRCALLSYSSVTSVPLPGHK